jgi:REP element-mobilizing transposase RayT
MPRIARIKSDGPGVYHLYNKVACHKGEFPFDRDGSAPKRKLLEILQFYAAAYECRIHAFTVMGNHFHFIAEFDDFSQLSRPDLAERLPLFYPNAPDQSKHWQDEHWDRFNRRIFDVSELMRSIQSSFARWYNHTYERKGRFWADRYKSTLLLDESALLECMQYVELNPVRAGIAPEGRPDQYAYSSLYWREIGKGDWLEPLRDLLSEGSESEALRAFKAQIYYRGGVKSKDGQVEIPEDILATEEANDFASRNVFSRKCRFFTDGLVLGAKEKVRSIVNAMVEHGVYRRAREPAEQLAGTVFCLRGQRGSFREI